LYQKTPPIFLVPRIYALILNIHNWKNILVIYNMIIVNPCHIYFIAKDGYSMMKVCVLASGSKGNAIYVANEKTAVLIDAGMSGAEIEKRLGSRGIDPETLDAVVVSHEHGDHIQGVGVLSRRLKIPVYATEPTLTATNGRLGAVGDVRHFEPGTGFNVGSLNLRPFPLSHDAVDPVGFTIHSNGTKIGIATDLGVATQLVCHHLKGCRLLVLEANHDVKMLEAGPYPWELKQRIRSRTGHLSNEASRDLLGEIADAHLEHVIVAHVSEKNNRPSRALSVVMEASTHPTTLFSLACQDKASDTVTLRPIVPE
jgi:phosphoribosyl 1,2-cyclic phosphodiesterase